MTSGERLTKTWFITGISSGIGAALAHAVLARGETVVGTSRDSAALDRFSATSPGRSIGLQLDVADEAQLASMAEKFETLGPIDILVNNAGQSVFGAFEETPLAQARVLFDVNLFGPWALTCALLPHFRALGRGTIINISSGCGISGTAGLSAYCASKFALEGLTETLAQEIAPFGIRTMLVEPGAIATRFISHGTQETKTRLADYTFLSGHGKAALEGYYATAASPPEAVAEAILTALDRDVLPLRLLVGEDVRQSVSQKAAALAALAES